MYKSKISFKSSISLDEVRRQFEDYFDLMPNDDIYYFMGCNLMLLDVKNELEFTKNYMLENKLEEPSIFKKYLSNIYEYGTLIFIENIKNNENYYLIKLTEFLGQVLSKRLNTKCLIDFEYNRNVEYCIYDKGEVELELLSIEELNLKLTRI